MKSKILFIILVLTSMLCLNMVYAQTTSNEESYLDAETKRIWGLTNLEKELDSDGELYVSSIKVSSNGEYITIKWNGVIESDIVYHVYRSATPIATRSILNNNATEIGSVVSQDNLSDVFSIQDYPPSNGPYYYAITTSISGMAHIFNAQPNTDMTIRSVYVDAAFVSDSIISPDDNASLPLIKLDTKNYVNGIVSRIHSRNKVILSWNTIENNNDVEYMLYRYTSPISNNAQLDNAELISKTKESFINDTLKPDLDAYYYISANTFEDNIFVAGDNYTIEPISISSDVYTETTETDFDINNPFYFKVNSMNAFIKDNDAVVQWKIPKIPSTNYYYLLFTSTNKFYSGQNVIVDSFLSTAKKISTSDVKSGSNESIMYIDNTAKSFINEPIYYSLFMVLNDQIPSVVLSDGMYTLKPITFKSDTDIIATNKTDQTNIAKEDEDKTKKPDVVKDNTKNDRETYNKAQAYFNKNKYQDIRNLLEPIANSVSDKKLYYDVNLLLAISYYKLGQKRSSLDILKKIHSASPKEVDFWIRQVLSDL